MGLGSGIRKKAIPDPGSGSRGQKGTGSQIRIRNTAESDIGQEQREKIAIKNVRLFGIVFGGDIFLTCSKSAQNSASLYAKKTFGFLSSTYGTN
jgi:hypothetical protein